MRGPATPALFRSVKKREEEHAKRKLENSKRKQEEAKRELENAKRKLEDVQQKLLDAIKHLGYLQTASAWAGA